MTSDGRPYARFRRAVERGNLLEAESAARELKELSITDALDYCDLLAQREPQRFERAAIQWHSRLEREYADLTLPQSLLALSALQALTEQDRGTPLSILRHLAKRASLQD
jgi:hypothetical protein